MGGLNGSWGLMEAKTAGWQRCPAVEEAAEWLASCLALPDMGTVWQVYSVGMGEGV